MSAASSQKEQARMPALPGRVLTFCLRLWRILLARLRSQQIRDAPGEGVEQMRTKKQPLRLPHYHSYLLRLWRGGPSGGWLGSLEDTASGEKQHFAGFESLVDFLRRQIEPVAQTGRDASQREELGHEAAND